MENRRDTTVVAIEMVASLLVGATVGLTFLASWWRFGTPPVGPASSVLAPTLAAVAVVAAPVLTRLAGATAARSWTLTGVALLAVAMIGPSRHLALPAGSLLPLLLVAAMLALGAALAAMTCRAPAPRWAVAALGVGILSGPAALVVTRWLTESLPGPGTGFPGPVVLLAVVAALAAAVATRRSAAAPGPAPGPPPTGPLVAVAVVAGTVVAADLLRRAVVLAVSASPQGFTSERRMAAVAALDTTARVAIALAVAAALVWYAYRRGRLTVVRWVIAGTALSVLVAGLYPGAAISGGAGVVATPWALTVAALAGVAAGAVLVRYADRGAPWDAVGLLVLAVGLALAVPRVSLELPVARWAFPYLILLGAGLVLAAGLGRVVAGAAPARPPADLAADAGLGFAAALLVAAPLAPVLLRPHLTGPVAGDLGMHGPVLVMLAMIAVLAGFALRRLVDRFRRDLRAEAPGG
jgi:hypothetical protein